MPFFYNSKSCLFLQNKSLDLYNDEVEEGVRVEFPPEVLDHLEIKNIESFEKLLSEFFLKYNLKNKICILVLSDNTLFQKTLKVKPDEDPSEKINTFFEEIPLDPEKVFKKQIPTDNELLLLSTNKDLFENIVKNVVETGAKVDAVVPASLFDIDAKKDQLTIDDIKQIIKQPELIKLSNFLSEQGESKFVQSVDPEHKSIMTRHLSPFLLAPILIVVIAVGTLTYLWFASDYIKIFLHQDRTVAVSNVQVTVSPSQTASASALPGNASPSGLPVAKADLTLEVLNGTDVAGLAKGLEDKLTAQGYQNIKVGNASSYASDDTEVVFGSRVSDLVKAELMQFLRKIFISVKGQDDSTLKGFDVVITEGKPASS